MGNRKLLWHGSQLGNWAGILKDGLRMEKARRSSFGIGIYFADCVDKSLEFSSTVGTGKQVLALCEVALGKPAPTIDQRVPKVHHSYFYQGGRQPDPAGDVTLAGGVQVSLGKLCAPPDPSGFWLNEYVVFHDHQIRIRYLLTVRKC